jgi:hypothetical protein
MGRKGRFVLNCLSNRLRVYPSLTHRLVLICQPGLDQRTKG